MACLRLPTFPEPERRVPRFRLRMALFTVFDAFFEYRLPDFAIRHLSSFGLHGRTRSFRIDEHQRLTNLGAVPQRMFDWHLCPGCQDDGEEGPGSEKHLGPQAAQPLASS